MLLDCNWAACTYELLVRMAEVLYLCSPYLCSPHDCQMNV